MERKEQSNSRDRRHGNKRIRGGGLTAAMVLLLLAVLPAGAAFAGEWKQESQRNWCFEEGGVRLQDALSPEGYYLDDQGIWTDEVSILGARLEGKNYFLDAERAGHFELFLDKLNSASDELRRIRDRRELAVYEDAVVVSTRKKDRRREVLMLMKNPDISGYTLVLKTHLSRDPVRRIGEVNQMPGTAEYDYQIMRLLLHVISRAGEKVTNAVYSSWEGNNSYGLKPGKWVRIGDAEILYQAENGAGKYLIRAAR